MEHTTGRENVPSAEDQVCMSVIVTKDLHEKLREERYKSNVSMSHIIRTALTKHFA